MKTVACIGLGSMGLPMAKNLLARGFMVRGFDVRTEAVTALNTAGGIGCGSAADACRDADVVLLMVVNVAQAEQVLLADGALDALPAHALVLLMATCPPGAVATLAGRVHDTGRRFVDAPVSGGVVGATNATLTIMAAADEATFAAIRPVLDALGDKVFHVGTQAGQGATAKTVNQLLCGVHLAVAAEALSLAAKVGVDLEVMLRIVSDSAAGSWMLRDRGPRMLQPEPEVTSAIDIFVKDLGIVLEAGRDSKVPLPLAALAHQLFLGVSGAGAGAADDSQVIRAYQALNSH